MNCRSLKILFSSFFLLFVLSGCAVDQMGKKKKNKGFKHDTPLIKQDVKKLGQIEIEKSAEMGPMPVEGDVAKLQKRITPDLAKAKNYTVKFNQKLQPGELTSSYFDITSSNITTQVQLKDVAGSDVVAPKYSGTGVVNAVKQDGSIIAEVGTIDYDSGTVSLPAITINALAGTEKSLRIGAGLQADSRDITTQALVRTSDTSTAAVVAKPSRNTVLTLDDSVVNTTINTTSGLVITAIPEVEEI